MKWISYDYGLKSVSVKHLSDIEIHEFNRRYTNSLRDHDKERVSELSADKEPYQLIAKYALPDKPSIRIAIGSKEYCDSLYKTILSAIEGKKPDIIDIRKITLDLDLRHPPGVPSQ